MTSTQLISITAFARDLLEEPLWEHQIDFCESPARYRVMCAGRQVGKSRTLAVESLFAAFTQRNALVLVISAGEEASKRLLADCSAMANRAPMLKGSILDDSKNTMTLTNGSRILSVPASDKQIRGWSVDLLIVDEAGFVSGEIWEAAEPAIVARPGSRVILSSSPWGAKDHFFRTTWQRGMSGLDHDTESWHWPSTVSPMADQKLIERWRETWPAHKFAREILAEWTDDSGAYFTAAELDGATAPYAYTDGTSDLFDVTEGQLCTGGIDWGFKRDANVLTLLSVLDDGTENSAKHDDQYVFYIPHLEAHHQMNSNVFIDRIVTAAKHYEIYNLVSEENGIGQFPTDTLKQEIRKNRYALRRWTGVSGVATTQHRKMNGFGALKVLLQQGRIVLPAHPELLKQLNSLHYEQSDNGLMRINVPESLGHDDYAMALMQAVSTINPRARRERAGVFHTPSARPHHGELLTTGAGTNIRQNPRAFHDARPLKARRQSKDTDQW